jgi:hypothetical protein
LHGPGQDHQRSSVDSDGVERNGVEAIALRKPEEEEEGGFVGLDGS